MEIEVTGAKILLELPFGITITETQVNMWIVMAAIAGVCIWLTHDLKVRPTSKRQIIAEFLVKTAEKFVTGNMGFKWKWFVPYVAALFSLAMFSSLISLLGMFAPTGDLNTTLGWAIMTFVLITFYKIRTNGVFGYAKSLTRGRSFRRSSMPPSLRQTTPSSAGCREYSAKWEKSCRFCSSVSPQYSRSILTFSAAFCRRSYSACSLCFISPQPPRPTHKNRSHYVHT